MAKREKSNDARRRMNLLSALGMTFDKQYLEEKTSIKYFGILGSEVIEGEVSCTKYINPDSGVYVYELDRFVEGVKFLFKNDINEVSNSILFYEDNVEPISKYILWIEGQKQLEINRHRILMDRYDALAIRLRERL